MKDATDYAQTVIDGIFVRPTDITPAGKTFLFNEFRKAQAEAISHAADLVQEQLNAVDPHIADTVSGNLRQTAAAMHPSQIVSIPAPSSEEVKTDTPELPPAA